MTLRVAVSSARRASVSTSPAVSRSICSRKPSACAAVVVLGLRSPQEFGDVHAAQRDASRQAGLGVVRRRSMPAVEAQ